MNLTHQESETLVIGSEGDDPHFFIFGFHTVYIQLGMIFEINLDLMDINLENDGMLGPNPVRHVTLLRVYLLTLDLRLLPMHFQLLFEFLKQFNFVFSIFWN